MLRLTESETRQSDCVFPDDSTIGCQCGAGRVRFNQESNVGGRGAKAERDYDVEPGDLHLVMQEVRS